MYKKPRVKYFICAVEKITAGIPAEAIERIVTAERAQANVYERTDGEAFISIPALFGKKDIPAPHGLVLKTGSRRTTLLAPKIDADLEIPEEDIRSLPEIFSGIFPFLRGACFTGRNMIFILDPGKLLEVYHD